MLGSTTNRFDLYDLVSGFFPGAVLVMGLLPFLSEPAVSKRYLISAVILLGGFVAGQSVRASARWLPSATCSWSSSKKFRKEVHENIEVSAQLKNLYYDIFRRKLQAKLPNDSFWESHSDWDIPEERPDSGFQDRESCDCDKNPCSSCEEFLGVMYLITQSELHMSGKGRARTFQALLDFYRNMWLVSGFLALLYVTYSSIVIFGPANLSLEYSPVIASSGLSGAPSLLIAVVALCGSYNIFRNGTDKYKLLYVRYLFSDYILQFGDQEYGT